MTVTRVSVLHRYVGLSTDTKPTVGVPAGSIFKVRDTDEVFEFDGTAWGGQSASDTERFAADDNTAHEFIFDTGGKRAVLIVVDNPTGTLVDLTVNVYGTNNPDASAGDADTHLIDGYPVTVAAGAQDEGAMADGFLYYIVIATFASDPNKPLIDVTISFSAVS